MTKGEIRRHKIAAKKLILIKSRAFELIKNNINEISEYDVSKFILSEFKKNNLEMEKKDNVPIVAANKNTSFVHYFPNKNDSKIIGKNSLILIDIWGKLKGKRSPFADITWMGYSGTKVPLEIKKTFDAVITARNIAVDFIKGQLKKKRIPLGKEVDLVVRDYFRRVNREKFFKHTTGHSLGFIKCHGKKFNLSEKENKKITLNVPFTIEPGLYFDNKFGIRSEIDCYVNQNYRLILTTEVQKEIYTFE